MSTLDTVAIVGAAQAGGRAAQAMRAAGFAGRIILIGEETYPPYERPPLSKELLTGDRGLDRVQLNEPGFYEKANIELRLATRVSAIDRAARQLRLDGGGVLAYDRLLLTTGARPRRIELPGAELAGVHYLRDLDDSAAIKAALTPPARLAVIGGGFIGLEVASSARACGCDVTVIEAADRLMGRALAPEISAHFAALHRRHGVALHLGAALSRIEGEAGRVCCVIFGGGQTIAADVVVIGIGILPNVELAQAAGIAIDNGIVVDEFGRSSDPSIYAAGDVANQPNAFLGRRVRLESYQNAQDQGLVVGRNMVADPKPHEDRLWVWTDQHGVNLQMLGAPRAWDRLVYRGDPASGSFTAFYLDHGRIVAVNTVDNGKELRQAERLMHAGGTPDPAKLADPAVRYRDLMAG